MQIESDDLCNANEVAQIIGLSSGGNVSLYRKRHRDFPLPAVDKAPCVLWLRPEVEAWARATGRLA